MTNTAFPEEVEQFLKYTLHEDIREGDHSSLSTIPASATGKAQLLVKQNGILAGMEVAKKIFSLVDEQLQLEPKLQDGAPISKGDIAFYVSGPSRSILTAERLVLNFMQRMSGIATLTNQFVKAVEGYDVKILDTRKTLPGLRYFEKWAVRIGGGSNHRFGLFDMIMIKDNHIDFSGGIERAIDNVHAYLKEKNLDLKVEIETRHLDEVQQVLQKGGVHRIMLDNFSYDDIRKAVEMIGGQYETEASGNVRLETVREYAATGVNFISSGQITHSAVALDLSLKSV